MLTIYLPLPEGHRYPNDEDAWFIDSLAELVDNAVLEVGGQVGGMETGPDEVGICVFDADPGQMRDLIIPLLKRHCPKGTYLSLFYDEEEEGADDDEIEEEMLFGADEEPKLEPLPLKSPEFAYRPFDMVPGHTNIEFIDMDKYVFEAIAGTPGIQRQYLSEYIDYLQHLNIRDEEIAEGLARLASAGYIYSQDDKLYVVDDLLKRLPHTAGGGISMLREDAWNRVHHALLGL